MAKSKGTALKSAPKAPRKVKATPAPVSNERGYGAAFPIVGIGASAGGLEAFTKLLQKLRVDTGMALVLIQHLDPTHESILTTLLARSTRMPVHEVSNR